MTCLHVFTKGQKAGSRCSIMPKNGAPYCSKHRNTVAARRAARTSESAGPSQPHPLIDDEHWLRQGFATCVHEMKGGPRRGLRCTRKIRISDGISMCATHTRQYHKKHGVLPTNFETLSSPTLVHLEPKSGDCSICMESGDDLVEVCDNKHLFHINCIREWGKRKRRCPCCRGRMYVFAINEARIVINQAREDMEINREAILQAQRDLAIAV